MLIARLRHAGRAAGLEDVERLAGQTPSGTQRRTGSAAQPLVLEVAELLQVVVALDVARAGRSRNPLAYSSQNGQPVSGSKCQRDDLAHVCVEPLPRLGDTRRRLLIECRRHAAPQASDSRRRSLAYFAPAALSDAAAPLGAMPSSIANSLLRLAM